MIGAMSPTPKQNCAESGAANSGRPGDERAAVECAIAMRALRPARGKRGGSDKNWQAVKFDYQIVAIAKANGASRMYARDEGLRGFANALGIKALDISDLELPPDAAQRKLDFETLAREEHTQSSAATDSAPEDSATPDSSLEGT